MMVLFVGILKVVQIKHEIQQFMQRKTYILLVKMTVVCGGCLNVAW